jgi:hypothetical protein
MVFRCGIMNWKISNGIDFDFQFWILGESRKRKKKDK